MTTSRKVLTCYVCALLVLLLSLPAWAAQDDPAHGTASAGNSGSGYSSSYPETWFSLQVAASLRLSSADKAVSRYRKKGFDSFYRYEDTGSKGMWYRIYIGRYPTKEEAKDVSAALIEQKIVDGFILRKMSAGQDDGYIVDMQVDEEATYTPVETDVPEPTQTASGPDLNETDSTAMKPPVVRLSLIDAIRYGLEGNREIHVFSYEPKQALADIEKSESVYDAHLFADATFRRDPDLETSDTDIVTDDETTGRLGIGKPLKTGGTLSTYLEVKNSDSNNRATERTYKHTVAPTIELKQPLLNNIGSKKERTAIKIANYQSNISNAEFRQKAIEVAIKITREYWKLYLYKELVDINQKNLDSAEEVLRREDERFTKGISQRLDVERARSNAQIRRSTLLNSVEEYALTMERLKLVLNHDTLNIASDSSVLPADQPKISPVKVEESETIAKALDNRPEIIKAREQLMIQKADQDLAAHQKLPSLDFIGRYSVSGYGDELGDAWDDVSMDDDDAWEVGLQFKWAFGNRSAKSSYKKKTLTRMQASAQIKRITDDVKLEVKQVLKRLATLKDKIQADMAAKKAAEKAVTGEFTRFDIGATSNEELLRAQDLLALTSRSLATSIAEYNIAIHELTRVQGLLPDGISMDAVGR